MSTPIGNKPYVSRLTDPASTRTDSSEKTPRDATRQDSNKEPSARQYDRIQQAVARWPQQSSGGGLDFGPEHA